MTNTILTDCCWSSNHWWRRWWWWWRTWWWWWRRWCCSQGRSNTLVITLGQLLLCGVIWNRVVVGFVGSSGTYLQLEEAAGGSVWQSSGACGSEPLHQPKLELPPPFDQLLGSASKAEVLPVANRPSSLCCVPSQCDRLCNNPVCRGKALPQMEGKPHRQQSDAGQEPLTDNHQNCAHR